MSHSSNNNNEKPRKDNDLRVDKVKLDDPSLQKLHASLMREKAEPQENMAPIPVFLMFLFGALLFWGGFYISKYSGNFRSDVFDHNWVPGAVAKVEAPFDPLVQGKKLYSRVCQQCHQADGNGLPGVYPPLVNSPWLLSSDIRPVKILLMGMNGPIEVLGNQYNGNMPAVGQWKDRDIAAVLTYVRQQWGNNAGPISEELVKEVRQSLGDRNKPWSGKEILELYPL